MYRFRIHREATGRYSVRDSENGNERIPGTAIQYEVPWDPHADHHGLLSKESAQELAKYLNREMQ